MLRHDTPVEDHLDAHGLLVKREDLSCPPPGPPFSKTRGVFAHVRDRPEKTIGVLDTYHSQAGHAVAAACALLGKRCVNFYPKYKSDVDGILRPQQFAARALGAEVRPLKAGLSAALYYRARRHLAQGCPDSYLMPNALKLPEMVAETAREAQLTFQQAKIMNHWGEMPETILVPVSSATIAAGVVRGWLDSQRASKHRALDLWKPRFILHMGYNRSQDALVEYFLKMSGAGSSQNVLITTVNEGYKYKEKARPGETPSWPCNEYYDLKTFRWWKREGREIYGEALLWNIG